MSCGYLLDDSSSKNKIISLLENNKALSVKQIHQMLTKHKNYQSSYQALHKTINQMVKEKILLKKENKYSINAKWLNERIHELSNILTSLEHEKLSPECIEEQHSVTNSFQTIGEVGSFLIDKIMQLPNSEKKPSLALWRLCYSPIGVDTQHINTLKKIWASGDWRVFIQEDSKVNRMFGDILKSQGLKHIKYGVKNCATELSDKFVVGDFVTEVIYSKSVRKPWSIYYMLPKQIAQLPLEKILEGSTTLKTKIQTITTKNKELADEYRKQYC